MGVYLHRKLWDNLIVCQFGVIFEDFNSIKHFAILSTIAIFFSYIIANLYTSIYGVDHRGLILFYHPLLPMYHNLNK